MMLVMVLFDILRYAAGSLFWGLLLTTAGISLLFFLIKSFYPRSTSSLFTYVVGTVLFFFLAFQSILLVGAFHIKSMDDDVRRAINTCLPAYWHNQAVELTPAECQQLLDHVTDTYPLVGKYIDYADFRGYDTTNIADAMVDELHAYLNAFIWRRVGWSLLFVAVGAFVAIRTLGACQSPGRRQGGGYSRRRYNDF